MFLLAPPNPSRPAPAPPPPAPPAPIPLLPTLTRLGVGRLLPTSFWSALPGPAASQFKAFAASPRGWRNTVDETATMPALLSQAQELATLGSTPLVVLTAGGHDQVGAEAQDRMAELSTNSSHRRTAASHAGLLDEEEGSAVSVQAIEDTVRAVRAGPDLPPD